MTADVLCEEQIAHFYREGYVVVPGLVPRATIARQVTAVQAVLAPPAGGAWTPSVFEHTDPTKSAPLHRLLVEPTVIRAAEQLLGSPPRVYYGMVAIVPAGGGTGLPWHQDNQYSTILGGALNVFLACCDVTPDMANLWVAPRSHLAGVRPSHEKGGVWGGHREADVEPDNGFVLPALAAGDACIFDRNLLHRSLLNETAAHRYAYAAQYQSDHAREASTGRRDPLRLPAWELRARLLPLLGD